MSGGLSFSALASAPSHTCGLTSAGTAYCWGQNSDGQLGTGSSTGPELCWNVPCSSTPVAVSGGFSFSAIAAGNFHTCGLTNSAAAYCWGANSFGQLGDGSTAISSAPVPIVGEHRFTGLATGGTQQRPPTIGGSTPRGHTCGLTSTATAYCWGLNDRGQLGNGSTTNSVTPIAVSSSLSFSVLALGGFHSCGLTRSGAAYCWGSNIAGQLGNGSTTDASTPVAVAGGLTFTVLGTGRLHTCGLTSDGAAYCWGNNAYGQLGDGSAASYSAAPVAVSGGLSFSSLATGGDFTCGATSAGAVSCWGSNGSGQLGDGSASGSSWIPVAVSGVTISGTSFVDITRVTIGGTALAAITVVSATEISGTTPPGTTSGAQDVMVTSSSRGTGGCTACFTYTQFPGPQGLRLSGTPPDSSRAPGALLMRVDGGPVSAITASGPAVPWASTAATPAHVIVSGALTPGMSLATLVVPDTQESVRRRYRVAVVQAATARGAGYRQLNPTEYVVSITPVGP